VLKISVFRVNSAKIRKGVNLGGELAGAERLACFWVGTWQEQSNWLVFGWSVGRSGATGLFFGGQLAGAKRLACIWVGTWQEQSDWLVFLSVTVVVLGPLPPGYSVTVLFVINIIHHQGTYLYSLLLIVILYIWAPHH
jgi:hypothetical protein